jgi:hypothetical protein
MHVRSVLVLVAIATGPVAIGDAVSAAADPGYLTITDTPGGPIVIEDFTLGGPGAPNRRTDVNVTLFSGEPAVVLTNEVVQASGSCVVTNPVKPKNQPTRIECALTDEVEATFGDRANSFFFGTSGVVAALTVDMGQGTAVVFGTAANQSDPNTAFVTTGDKNDRVSFPVRTVGVFATGAGNDNVTVNGDGHIEIDTGAGHDTVSVTNLLGDDTTIDTHGGRDKVRLHGDGVVRTGADVDNIYVLGYGPIESGPARDVVEAFNNRANTIDCGGAPDRKVLSDNLDTLMNCG